MRVVNCVPVVRTGSVTVMARDIGLALGHLGADVRDMDYVPGRNITATFPELMNWLAASKDAGLLIDINGAIVTSKPAGPFLAARPVEFNCFTFLTDAPLHFPSRFEKWPKDAIVGLVDNTFHDIARFMKYDRPNFINFAHAGPQLPERTATTAERDIDVLVIGNVAAIEPAQAHAENLYPGQPKLAALFVNGFHRYDPSKTPFQTALETAIAMKESYLRKDVALAAVHLEMYQNNMMRATALSKMHGLKVTLVGSIAKDALEPNSDVRALGFVPFDACLELMGKARIVVNIRPGFPNGAHERVFYALSRGAAVVTTYSVFLEKDRRAHDFIEFFTVDSDGLREQLEELLDRIDTDAIDRAEMLRHYAEHHTWRHRLEPVLTRVRQQFA